MTTRHLFVINPAAGKTDRSRALLKQAEESFSGKSLDFSSVLTKGRGDATLAVQREAERGIPLRVYACGGDGTLNEAVNGAALYPHVAITHIPIGSGNDFVKVFGPDAAAFFTPEQLLDAEEAELDLMECNGRFAVNICSVGLDARIGLGMVDFKCLPFVSGTMAYQLSLLSNFIKGIHRPYEVEVDGQRFSGDFTLLCACNGQWYGGGFHPAPEARPDDGLLDLLIVKAVSRLTAIRVVKHYAQGRAKDYPHIITSLRGREMRILCDRESRVNLDGEEIRAKEITCKLSDRKLRFFYPKCLSWPPPSQYDIHRNS